METIFKNKHVQIAAIFGYVAAMCYIAFEMVK